MTARWTTGRWVDGLAEWIDGDTVYLSVSFSWRAGDAYDRAVWYRTLGKRVVAGGPGLFHPELRHNLGNVAEVPTRQTMVNGKMVVRGAEFPDAIRFHNPMATIASHGCPVGCYFCIVPAIEGRTFTELPDFPVRPVLCDNNLSALSAEYQDHIVSRYVATGVPLLDANSGFEPRTFDEEVWRRWKPINRGPWRFAYDDHADGPHVERVMRMLREVSPRKKQVYTLIGNESFDACVERIQRVISWGGEPYAQPIMKLNADEKKPWVRYDWNEVLLKRVQRWVNRRGWRKVPFSKYRASAKTVHRSDAEVDLFDGVAA